MRTYTITQIASALGTTRAKVQYLCEHTLDIKPISGSKYSRESVQRILTYYLEAARKNERQAKEAFAWLLSEVK